MKRIITIFILLFAFFCSISARNDSVRVEKWLREAMAKPSDTNWMVYFGRRLRGIPYVAHTLEKNGAESLVVNTRQMDCTTLVENCTALTLCMKNGERSYGAYKKYLQMIRYRDGKIKSYASRLHYFTQWIEDNTKKGIVREVQMQEAPFTATQVIDIYYMSRNPEKYDALKRDMTLVNPIREYEQEMNGRTYRYIPRNHLGDSKALRRAVKDGDILAIVTSIGGLDTSHIGIAVWHKDGLHLLNASSIHHKVVEEPMTLQTYMKKHPKQMGVRVIRIDN